jgi:acetyltransferase-like isoleucine patch superfamily enzyme
MLTAKSRLPIRDIILFGLLPSFLKIWVYRMRGYKIGAKVSLGFGSVVVGESVDIGKNVEIGFFSIIRGKQINLSSYVRVGSFSFLDTPIIEIGEGTRINEQVFVGGLQFPDSRLKIGRNSQIMQMTFINPTRSITIGDDTGIGGDCLIFGHTSWLSRFEGYPTEFKSIEIGNSVSVAWRVFVSAGAKIEDGAVIGANSMVNRKIPARCLAVGSPAKVVAKAPYFPRTITDVEKKSILREIVGEMVTFLQGYGLECRREDSLIEVKREVRSWFWRTHKIYRLWVEEEALSGSMMEKMPKDVDVFLSLQSISEDVRKKLIMDGTMWIDVEKKEQYSRSNELGEEVSQFLRRYGVRLSRV